MVGIGTNSPETNEITNFSWWLSFQNLYMQKAICPLSRRFLRVMSMAEKGA